MSQEGTHLLVGGCAIIEAMVAVLVEGSTDAPVQDREDFTGDDPGVVDITGRVKDTKGLAEAKPQEGEKSDHGDREIPAPLVLERDECSGLWLKRKRLVARKEEGKEIGGKDNAEELSSWKEKRWIADHSKKELWVLKAEEKKFRRCLRDNHSNIRIERTSKEDRVASRCRSVVMVGDDKGWLFRSTAWISLITDVHDPLSGATYRWPT